jgi:hypothetical protein
MACEDKHDEWYDYCEKECPYNTREITKCWQKYFEERVEEGK